MTHELKHPRPPLALAPDTYVVQPQDRELVGKLVRIYRTYAWSLTEQEQKEFRQMIRKADYKRRDGRSEPENIRSHHLYGQIRKSHWRREAVTFSKWAVLATLYDEGRLIALAKVVVMLGIDRQPCWHKYAEHYDKNEQEGAEDLKPLYLPDAHALAARRTTKIAFSAPFERDEKDGDNDRVAMAVDEAPALIEAERDVASAPKRTFSDVELDMAQPAAKRQDVHGGCDQDKDERGIVDLVGSPSRTATPQREGSCIVCCTNDTMAGCGRGEEFERREAQMRQEIEELRKQIAELRQAKDSDSRAVAHILEEIAELRLAKDSESREKAEIRKEIDELRKEDGAVVVATFANVERLESMIQVQKLTIKELKEEVSKEKKDQKKTEADFRKFRTQFVTYVKDVQAEAEKTQRKLGEEVEMTKGEVKGLRDAMSRQSEMLTRLWRAQLQKLQDGLDGAIRTTM